MPYFSPKEVSSALEVETTTPVNSVSASGGNEGAELLLSLSSTKKMSPVRLNGSSRASPRRGFFHSPIGYSSDTSSDSSADEGRDRKRAGKDNESKQSLKKRPRKEKTINLSMERVNEGPSQSPQSTPGKRVISPSFDGKGDVPTTSQSAPSHLGPHGRLVPHGAYPVHPGYGYAMYHYPPAVPPPHHVGFAYAGASPYYAMHHPRPPPPMQPPHVAPGFSHPAHPTSPAISTPMRKSPVASPEPSTSTTTRPTSRASASSDEGSPAPSPASHQSIKLPPLSPQTLPQTDPGRSSVLPEEERQGGLPGRRSGRCRCVLVENASSRSIGRGSSADSPEATTISVPEFHRLANFPEFLNKGRTIEKCPVAPAGRKYCVMCGELRLCSSTGRGKASREDVSHIIPRQNKGVCTACDIAVWSVTDVPGLEIKWCKGCKNFRQWKSFGQKGNATKCVRCRERQKEKYASQKYGRAPDYSAPVPKSTGDSFSSSSKKGKSSNEDDYLIAAASLRRLRESP